MPRRASIKIATFNVNGIGARLSHLLEWLAREQPDVVALQELKAGLNDSETARACEVWQRKFGTVATDPEGRQKQMRFLMQRGFSQKAVRTAMKGEVDDDFYD